MEVITRFLWAGVILACLLLALRQPYFPMEPVGIAVRFIEAVGRHDFSAAYDMTTKGALVGFSVAGFRRGLERASIGKVPPGSITGMKLNRVSPFQSYGNRLRRFLTRRMVDPDQYSVDHLLTVVGSSTQVLPFEVRLVRGADEVWRIEFFQVHAM